MRAIDTNVLVRLVMRDDERQVSRAETFLESGIWISHLVLAEAIWVLSSVFLLRDSQLADALEMLLANERVAVQDPEVVHAALAHYRKRPSLGFTDCMVIEIARKHGHLPLGTFDRGLAKLDGAQAL